MTRLAAAQDAAPTAEAPLRIVATAEIDGQLASANCAATGPSRSLFTDAATRIAGAPDAVAIDGGNLVGAAAVSRGAIELDAAGFARAITQVGWRALGVGHRDLSAPRETLLAASHALAAAGVPMVLSNLACSPDARAVCAAVTGPTGGAVLLHTPHGTLGLAVAIDPSWMAYVARDRALGVTLTDPAEALARATTAARAAGADRVVAVYDPPYGDEVGHALALATHLGQGARPDVLLVHGIGNALRTAVAAESGVPLVAFGARGSATVIEPGAAHADPTEPPDAAGPGPEAARAFARVTTAALCARGSTPLAGASLEHPLDRERFADLLLDVLRESARAEIAIINRGAIAGPAGLFPLRGTMAPLEIARAMPYDNSLRVGRVRGSVLKELLKSSRAPFFFVRGAVLTGDHVTINGRPLEDTSEYRVVTTDYVAEGGDGAFGTAHLVFDRYGTDSARDVFVHWLGRSRPPHEVTLAPIDPADRTRWTFHATLDASLTSTYVDNHSGTVLTDSQLTRGQALAINTDATIHADADHPYYTWENHLRMQYAVADTVPVGGPDPGLTETEDLIAARTVGVFRHVRAHERPRWYDPLPYAETYLESEFTRPATRAYHHLELRPDAGIRFELIPHFSAHIGLGADWEVLATPDQLTPRGSTVVPVAVAGWSLKPGTVFSLAGRPVTAESLLDVVYRDPFGSPGMLGRFHARLAVPIFQPVSVTLTYDAFVRYTHFADASGIEQGVWGWSGDLSIGLRIAFDRAVQTFRY